VISIFHQSVADIFLTISYFFFAELLEDGSNTAKVEVLMSG
jgi:hypothetical protein